MTGNIKEQNKIKDLVIYSICRHTHNSLDVQVSLLLLYRKPQKPQLYTHNLFEHIKYAIICNILLYHFQILPDHKISFGK